MTNKLGITAKTDKYLGGLSRRGLGMKKTCRTEKSEALFLIVLHVIRRRMCIGP
jgi:hypothetical protein